MQTSVKGQIVFVTGGARRVGRAFALAFASAGAHVAIHHSNSEADAEATADAIRAHGVESLVVKGDYAVHADVTRTVDETIARFGRIDVLVNSASIFLAADLLDVTDEDWERALALNTRSPFWTTQAVGRYMRDRGEGGCIINICDTSGVIGWPDRPVHSVSKAALLMLTTVTAQSLAKYQIRANALVLGPVLPENGRDADSIAKTAERLPLKRWGTPEDPARAAVFLAENDWITGAALRVDGGEGMA